MATLENNDRHPRLTGASANCTCRWRFTSSEDRSDRPPGASSFGSYRSTLRWQPRRTIKKARNQRSPASTVTTSGPRARSPGPGRRRRTRGLGAAAPADEPLQAFDAQGELAQGERPLCAPGRGSATGAGSRSGVVRAVDDPQVLAAPALHGGLGKPLLPRRMKSSGLTTMPSPPRPGQFRPPSTPSRLAGRVGHIHAPCNGVASSSSGSARQTCASVSMCQTWFLSVWTRPSGRQQVKRRQLQVGRATPPASNTAGRRRRTCRYAPLGPGMPFDLTAPLLTLLAVQSCCGSLPAAATARGSAARPAAPTAAYCDLQKFLGLGRPRHQFAVEADPRRVQRRPRSRRRSAPLAPGRGTAAPRSGSLKNRRPVRV